MPDVGVGGGKGYGEVKPSVCSPRLMLRLREPLTTVAPVVTRAVLLREIAGLGTGDGRAGAGDVSMTATLACLAIEGRRTPGRPRRGDSDPERNIAEGNSGGSSGRCSLRSRTCGDDDELEDDAESIEAVGRCRAREVDATGE